MDETIKPPVAVPDPQTPASPDNPAQIKVILEAVLLSAQQPVSMLELRKVFADAIGGDVLRAGAAGQRRPCHRDG